MSEKLYLGKYKHYKGKEYEVIGITKYSETLEDLVVYRALSGRNDLWVRPLKMFLETVENFKKFLADTEFQKISFSDITDHVMPSSKRLYKYSLPAMFFGKIAEFLNIRTKTQTGNIIAARYQYKALLKNLWKYGFFMQKSIK